ncbi:MAG: hypothetical protein V1859_11225 [archaeon]
MDIDYKDLPIEKLFDEEGTGNSQINDETMEDYYFMFLAIEEPIYLHHKNNPNLKDIDVIRSLKNVRDNLLNSGFEFSSMENDIIDSIKNELIENIYNKRDVLLSISKILNFARYHKDEGEGYLLFLDNNLPDALEEKGKANEEEEVESEEEIDFSSLSNDKKYSYLIGLETDDNLDGTEYLNLAQELINANEIDKAKTVLYKAIEFYFYDFNIYEMLGELYLNEKDYGFSMHFFSRALEMARQELIDDESSVDGSEIPKIDEKLKLSLLNYIPNEEIQALINELTKYDNEEGYALERNSLKEHFESVSEKIVAYGEKAVYYLLPLLSFTNTYSVDEAIEILGRIKSEKAVIPLIKFIRYNENCEYDFECSDAAGALIDIGIGAVSYSINELKQVYLEKRNSLYLLDVVFSIKSEKSADFAHEIIDNILANPAKYCDWFEISDILEHIPKQEDKSIIEKLEKLKDIGFFKDGFDYIDETIDIIKDPESHEQRQNEIILDLVKTFTEPEILKRAIHFAQNSKIKLAGMLADQMIVRFPKSYSGHFIKYKIEKKLGNKELNMLEKALILAKENAALPEVIDSIEQELIESR